MAMDHAILQPNANAVLLLLEVLVVSVLRIISIIPTAIVCINENISEFNRIRIRRLYRKRYLQRPWTL